MEERRPRAVVYERFGEPEVLRVVEREIPAVGPGDVRVRIAVSGVNPTDWKARRGSGSAEVFDAARTPHQDGSGVVDAVGDGVDDLAVGERVWVWDAAYERTQGTAQELVVLPRRHVVRLPAQVGFDVGASLGIPALTAHLALMAHPRTPHQLAPGTLENMAILVTGGAGAVGHAAIQLARWAGAHVFATVSGPEKARLAGAAGAHTVIDYRHQDVASVVRSVFAEGADIVVDVDAAANLDASVDAVGNGGVICVYARDSAEDLVVPVRPLMVKNARLQFILTYTSAAADKDAAIAAVAAAVADGAMGVGAEKGLPVHRFALQDVVSAHRAAENGVVGKVLIDVAEL